MGKPFEKEIAELESTYQWACKADISEVSRALCATWDTPLLVVGSGGSFSAAEYHATLHRTFFKSVAQAITPMELVSALPRDGRSSVWFMSASGNNIDIRRAFKHAALMEPKAVSALVGMANSKLAQLSSKYLYTNLFEYNLPSGKDGFLATNSLFGFATLLYRAYCEATRAPESLPPSLKKLISSQIPSITDIDDLLNKTKLLWEQEVVHVIYSPTLKGAALDLESKFIEAGLGSVHLADLRNFAHGRHHWFSKNNSGNGVLALTSQQDSNLAFKTLDLLPNDIPKAQVTFADDSCGLDVLVGLLISIHFTHQRGLYKNIDPGRPGVPSYGSKIYRLTAKSGFTQSIPKATAAIERKQRLSPLSDEADYFWENAYRAFARGISKQPFGGVVLDYDGTVVDGRLRGRPPRQEICEEINRLLECGLKIGFATGRGKSIRSELQDSGLIPEKHWKKITIGYYNGSDLSSLSDNHSPDGTDGCSEDLRRAFSVMNENPLLGLLEREITQRQKQITIEPKTAFPETFLWDLAKDYLSQEEEISAQVVRSSHSIDIIASDVTKLAVVRKIRAEIPDGTEVLTIGDRGRWPGNDTALLSEPYSLSVDEVSFSPDRCWNLCPAGERGPQGALGYLRRLVGGSGVVHFK